MELCDMNVKGINYLMGYDTMFILGAFWGHSK